MCKARIEGVIVFMHVFMYDLCDRIDILFMSINLHRLLGGTSESSLMTCAHLFPLLPIIAVFLLNVD